MVSKQRYVSKREKTTVTDLNVHVRGTQTSSKYKIQIQSFIWKSRSAESNILVGGFLLDRVYKIIMKR